MSANLSTIALVREDARLTGWKLGRPAGVVLAVWGLALAASAFGHGPMAGDSTTNTARSSLSETNAGSEEKTNRVYVLDDKHLLAIGDRVNFQIKEDDDDPKPLTVTDSGDLTLPYIGPFHVVGMTCKELAGAVKADLEKGLKFYVHATVVIAVDSMVKSHGRVYLYGSVHLPGPQEIPSDETFTVGKAIQRAGGLMDFANERTVRITRKLDAAGHNNTNIVVDVGAVLRRGKLEQDVTLEPDDYIYVSDRAIRFP